MECQRLERPSEMELATGALATRPTEMAAGNDRLSRSVLHAGQATESASHDSGIPQRDEVLARTARRLDRVGAAARHIEKKTPQHACPVHGMDSGANICGDVFILLYCRR